MLLRSHVRRKSFSNTPVPQTSTAQSVVRPVTETQKIARARRRLTFLSESKLIHSDIMDDDYNPNSAADPPFVDAEENVVQGGNLGIDENFNEYNFLNLNTGLIVRAPPIANEQITAPV